MDFLSKAKEAAEKLKKASSTAFDLDGLQRSQSCSHDSPQTSSPPRPPEVACKYEGCTRGELLALCQGQVTKLRVLEEELVYLRRSTGKDGGGGFDGAKVDHDADLPSPPTRNAPSSSLAERYAALEEQYRTLESRFNEVSLTSPRGDRPQRAEGAISHGGDEALKAAQEEKEKLMAKMKELLGRYRGLQKAAGEVKAQNEERAERVAALEVALARAMEGKEGGKEEGKDEEVLRLRAENAKLIEKMKEVLVRYRSMQQLMREEHRHQEHASPELPSAPPDFPASTSPSPGIPAASSPTACPQGDPGGAEPTGTGQTSRATLLADRETWRAQRTELEETQKELVQALEKKNEVVVGLEGELRRGQERVGRMEKEQEEREEAMVLMNAQLAGLRAAVVEGDQAREEEREGSTEVQERLRGELEALRETLACERKAAEDAAVTAQKRADDQDAECEGQRQAWVEERASMQASLARAEAAGREKEEAMRKAALLVEEVKRTSEMRVQAVEEAKANAASLAEATVEAWTEKHAVQERRMREWEEQVGQLETSLQALEKGKSGAVARLEEEVETLRADVRARTAAEASQKASEAAKTQAQAAQALAWAKEREELREKCAAYEEAIQAWEVSKEEWTTRLTASLQEKEEEWETRWREMERETEGAQGALRGLKKEVAKQAEEKEQAVQTLREAQAAMDRMGADGQEKEKENKRLQEELQAWKEEDAKDKATKEAKHVDRERAVEESWRVRLAKEKEELTRVVEGKEAARTAAERRIGELEKEQGQLKKEMEALQAAQEEGKMARDRLREENKAAVAACAAKEEAGKVLQGRMEAMEKEQEEKQREHEERQSEWASLEKAAQASATMSEGAMHELRAEVEKLKQALTEAQKGEDAAREQAAGMEKEKTRAVEEGERRRVRWEEEREELSREVQRVQEAAREEGARVEAAMAEKERELSKLLEATRTQEAEWKVLVEEKEAMAVAKAAMEARLEELESCQARWTVAEEKWRQEKGAMDSEREALAREREEMREREEARGSEMKTEREALASLREEVTHEREYLRRMSVEMQEKEKAMAEASAAMEARAEEVRKEQAGWDKAREELNGLEGQRAAVEKEKEAVARAQEEMDRQQETLGRLQREKEEFETKLVEVERETEAREAEGEKASLDAAAAVPALADRVMLELQGQVSSLREQSALLAAQVETLTKDKAGLLQDLEQAHADMARVHTAHTEQEASSQATRAELMKALALLEEQHRLQGVEKDALEQQLAATQQAVAAAVLAKEEATASLDSISAAAAAAAMGLADMQARVGHLEKENESLREATTVRRERRKEAEVGQGMEGHIAAARQQGREEGKEEGRREKEGDVQRMENERKKLEEEVATLRGKTDRREEEKGKEGQRKGLERLEAQQEGMTDALRQAHAALTEEKVRGEKRQERWKAGGEAKEADVVGARGKEEKKEEEVGEEGREGGAAEVRAALDRNVHELDHLRGRMKVFVEKFRELQAQVRGLQEQLVTAEREKEEVREGGSEGERGEMFCATTTPVLGWERDWRRADGFGCFSLAIHDISPHATDAATPGA
jgi:chromosome segregation ATPase